MQYNKVNLLRIISCMSRTPRHTYTSTPTKTKKHPFGCLVYSLGFGWVLRGTLRRYFFERCERYRKKLPYSRLWQTAKPNAALRLRRRTVLPLAKNSSPLILLLRAKQKSTRLGAFVHFNVCSCLSFTGYSPSAFFRTLRVLPKKFALLETLADRKA